MVEQLGEQLRTGARAPTPSAEHIRMRLGLAPAALMRALLDLRATVEDFTPTFGYPRVAKRHFDRLIEELAASAPEARAVAHTAVEKLLSGEWSGVRREHALRALGEVYDLDFRVSSLISRRGRRVEVDRDGLRNMAIASMSRRDGLGLIPAERFSAFASMWVDVFAPAAVAWYEAAYPPPLDPRAYAGYPTIERVEHLLESGEPTRYRHFLGKQPPSDLVDVVLSSDLEPTAIQTLARWLSNASGKRWKAVARYLEEGVEEA